jgi:oxygen-dependent protoporphyrinogen oxidase
VTTRSRRPASIGIIGGGITGLSAALRITELDPACRLTLWEASARLGGVVSTIHEEGYQVEQSADNFITTVPWGIDLCKRLGLASELVHTNAAYRQTFVVRRGRLHKLPDGFLMMAPTRLWPLAVTPLLSPWGKLRAAWEYFLPPRLGDDDESMAQFVRRRLGREVFERLVEPLVSAVYAADMERLSLLATLSQFREMEVQYGSLIRAMRARMASAKTAPAQSGARYSMFVTPRAGLSSMVHAIAGRLPQGVVRLQQPVERIERCEGQWRVFTAAGQPESCDALIVATPAHVAARLVRPVAPELAADLASIEHSGSAVLSVAYERTQIAHRLDGMGAVVPAIEHSPILACSFSSQKYGHRTPEGRVLLRVFAGGARRPELAAMDADELEPLLLDELAKLLGIRGAPVYRNLARWPAAMPQYHVGHRELVARIEARTATLAQLELAGNAFHGVGLPHCIHSGELAAGRALGVTERGSSAAHRALEKQ